MLMSLRLRWMNIGVCKIQYSPSLPRYRSRLLEILPFMTLFIKSILILSSMVITSRIISIVSSRSIIMMS